MTIGGSDATPAGVGTISGLDKIQYQVDGGPWTTGAQGQQVSFANGTHTIGVRSFDVAGNAAYDERTVSVDLTNPTAAITAYPPAPNTQGYYRQTRTAVVAVDDTRESSGAASATAGLDAAALTAFPPAVTIPSGTHTVRAAGRDRVGRVSPTVSLPASTIDLVRPTASPSNTAPAPILIQVLGIPSSNTLAYTAADDVGKVKVTVFVYDTLGTYVRRIPVVGPLQGGFRNPGSGSVSFNGRNDGGGGVLPGSYTFRVQVIDQAGNSALSSESPPFLVVLGVLPLGGLTLPLGLLG